MKYTKIPNTAFENIQLNAGILTDTFDPATGEIGNLIGATSGGVNFTDSVEYKDFGEDIDNCPKNCMELKHKEDGEITLSGNLVTLNKQLVKMNIGAATIEGNKITPNADLRPSDFMDELWGLADWGDGGLLAIKMKRVLNTSGFSIATTDKNKAQIAFTYTCHKTITNLKDPPYEVYLLTP